MELKKALATYDIMEWAKHRAAVHELRHAKYFWGKARDEDMWPEVIKRLEDCDVIGLRGILATFVFEADERDVLAFACGLDSMMDAAPKHLYGGSTSIPPRIDT